MDMESKGFFCKEGVLGRVLRRVPGKNREGDVVSSKPAFRLNDTFTFHIPQRISLAEDLICQTRVFVRLKVEVSKLVFHH